MKDINFEDFRTIFSICRRTLGYETWGRVWTALDNTTLPQDFPDSLDLLAGSVPLPDFISDLARIEWAWHKLRQKNTPIDPSPQQLTVNPSLSLIPVSWKHLFSITKGNLQPSLVLPEPASTYVIMWRHTEPGKFEIREAEDIDLLALKIVIDNIDPLFAAELGNASVGDIQTAINRAVNQGLLISPPSRIRRPKISVDKSHRPLASFISPDTFTLQWHITQACDLHCKHCYDRSDRSPMGFSDAVRILNEFYEFCCHMNVTGKISFTGGNPLLYPHFFDLYKAASDMGFGLAILGNPSPEKYMEALLGIAKPLYFQISLEGLEEHNDYIRGKGHFNRSLVFLDVLRKLNIFSMVMLTLTRSNLDQVLPLANELKGRADFFTFNRLSTVGEGAQLLLPLKSDFEDFLRTYEEAAANSPLLGIKDNLFNILRKEKDKMPFGGCTGYGCGAAFNFVALLPDGEVHACRKFPSPLGNVFKSPLMEIFHSDLAQKYRNGPEACQDCTLSLVCRGCLANTYSHGQNIFKDKDPFCFIPT